MRRYPSMCWYELRRSFSRELFCRSLQRLVPEIQPGDLATGGSGVRAQAIAPEGELVQDFRLIARPNALHVLNAPSPAATASLGHRRGDCGDGRGGCDSAPHRADVYLLPAHREGGSVVNPSHATRRAALGTAALGALSYRRLLGANDRVQVGFIGYGLIGAQHVFDFKNQKDADLAAMCDVYQPRLEQGVAACGGGRQAVFRFPPHARQQGPAGDRRLHARPLARPDDHDGLRRRQGRVRRKAADPFRPGRPLDDSRRPPPQPRRAGGHAAALRPALPACARTAASRLHRQDHEHPRRHLSQHHAGLRLARRQPPRRAISTTTCGSVPRPRGPTTRSAASIISAGSGITPAAR